MLPRYTKWYVGFWCCYCCSNYAKTSSSADLHDSVIRSASTRLMTHEVPRQWRIQMQTDRQIYKQTHRQTHRQPHRQTRPRLVHSSTLTYTRTQANTQKYSDIHVHVQTENERIYRQTNNLNMAQTSKSDRHTEEGDVEKERKTARQRYRETDRDRQSCTTL